jgi:hypothetical protein
VAPLEAGASLGHIAYMLDGKEIGRVEVCGADAVQKIGFGTLFWNILSQILFL